MRTTSQNNGETVTTLSKMEFSDNDDFNGEAQEEQNGPEDGKLSVLCLKILKNRQCRKFGRAEKCIRAGAKPKLHLT